MHLNRYAVNTFPSLILFPLKTNLPFLSIQAEESWVGYSTYLLAIAECLAIPMFYVARIILSVLRFLNVFLIRKLLYVNSGLG